MFTNQNFHNDGIEYDYDALNDILNAYLSQIENFDENDVKNYSDKINDSLVERDGKIYHHDAIVGTMVND